VVANSCSYEETNGKQHSDERHNRLARAIASLIIVRFIVRWAL